MKAVMYGGGNIGRGFIGALLSRSGYDVTFIDVAPSVVEPLHNDHRYPVRILEDDTYTDIEIKNVDAINGNNVSAVAEAIANADIMATAVGVNILKFIISNIVAGIRLRKERGCAPFNIIICENLMDANKVMEGMIKEHLTDDEKAWFDNNIGLVEASIGRMVPVQTDEMKDGDPLRVCVESYGYLPVDKDAFKGEIPHIENMIPFSPFDFYIKRKLYIHNMGHAICAYLGDLVKLTYIWEAIDRDDIYIIVKNAMLESAQALSKKYNVDLSAVIDHITDLTYRFTNKALCDTCKRVGGDPKRKLSYDDRLIGSCRTALENGITPSYIALGTAAAIVRFINESDEFEQSEESALKVLAEISGIKNEERLTEIIMSFYRRIINGATIPELRRAADKLKHGTMVRMP